MATTNPKLLCCPRCGTTGLEVVAVAEHKYRLWNIEAATFHKCDESKVTHPWPTFPNTTTVGE